jgi:GDP/GTP exchange factor Sec2p
MAGEGESEEFVVVGGEGRAPEEAEFDDGSDGPEMAALRRENAVLTAELAQTRSNLEAEQAIRLLLEKQETTLKDTLRHVVQELDRTKIQLSETLVHESDERDAREGMERELEALTQQLFEEANAMVSSEARKAHDVSREKVRLPRWCVVLGAASSLPLSLTRSLPMAFRRMFSHANLQPRKNGSRSTKPCCAHFNDVCRSQRWSLTRPVFRMRPRLLRALPSES